MKGLLPFCLMFSVAAGGYTYRPPPIPKGLPPELRRQMIADQRDTQSRLNEMEKNNKRRNRELTQILEAQRRAEIKRERSYQKAQKEKIRLLKQITHNLNHGTEAEQRQAVRAAKILQIYSEEIDRAYYRSKRMY